VRGIFERGLGSEAWEHDAIEFVSCQGLKDGKCNIPISSITRAAITYLFRDRDLPARTRQRPR
jgi:hypothetical protein